MSAADITAILEGLSPEEQAWVARLGLSPAELAETLKFDNRRSLPPTPTFLRMIERQYALRRGVITYVVMPEMFQEYVLKHISLEDRDLVLRTLWRAVFEPDATTVVLSKTPLEPFICALACIGTISGWEDLPGPVEGTTLGRFFRAVAGEIYLIPDIRDQRPGGVDMLDRLGADDAPTVSVDEFVQRHGGRTSDEIAHLNRGLLRARGAVLKEEVSSLAQKRGMVPEGKGYTRMTRNFISCAFGGLLALLILLWVLWSSSR